LLTVNILDPTKELDIKFLSFRDKLQPGELEKWKLKITNKAGEKQMAEMVATLYDASLDALKTMNWQEIRTGYHYGGYSWASNLGHTSQGNALWFLKPYYDYYRTFIREYESLSSYLTPYATNGQGQYNMYLKTADKNLLKRDSIETALKLSRLAKGTKVFGIIKDDFGFVVPDASVVVNNKTQTKTDRYGIYEIAARGGDIVHVKIPGYQPYLVKVKQGQKRLNITLKNDYNRLAEVVIRGYQKRSREQTTGSSYIVSGKEVTDGAPALRSSTNIRGLSTSNDNTVLLQGRVAGLNIQEDTKVYDFVTIDSYDPKTGNYITPITAGLALSWNFGSLWSNKNRESEARIERDQTVINKGIITDDLKNEVNQNYQNYLSALNRVNLLQTSIAQATENNRLQESRYRSSIASATDRADAQTLLYQAQINLELAKADAGLAYYNLLKSTGKINK
ncbi:MAG: hypothetical protein EOP45_12920, partial [Sphingobacteriaceae bacterium]